MKSAVGLFVAWLAAWCQVIALVALPMGPLVAAAGPLGDVPICHAEVDGQPAPSQPNHPQHDCVLCALCVTDKGAIAILATSPALPVRQVVAMARLDAV